MIDMSGLTGVRDKHLASDLLPGNRKIDTAHRLAALDLLLDEYKADMTPANADVFINYIAWRYERGEIDGARKQLSEWTGLTGAYRIEAVLHAGD